MNPHQLAQAPIQDLNRTSEQLTPSPEELEQRLKLFELPPANLADLQV